MRLKFSVSILSNSLMSVQQKALLLLGSNQMHADAALTFCHALFAPGASLAASYSHTHGLGQGSDLVHV